MHAPDLLDRLFDRLPPAAIMGVSLALVILVGWVDFYIDPNTSLSIFYIIPIVIGAWYAGPAGGWSISILSAVTWTYTYYASNGPNAHSPVLFWNGLVRLGFFVIIAQLLLGLKDKTRKLNELAHIDSLTETFNSRAFHFRLGEEIKRSRRYGRPFSVAYIDLDNFKSVNDLHGHASGDRLLKDVTAVMKNNARSTDFIARMGGDEFTILFPEAGSRAAREADFIFN